MNNTVHYTNCPICIAQDFKKKLTAKDYTVSGNSFDIMQCAQCSLCFTQDAPDAAHIGPYYKAEEYISHTDTSKGIVNSLYQKVRKRTLKSKRKLIQQTTGLLKGNLLDVGSGTGAFVNEMKQHGWEVKGLEPDEDARAVAKKTFDVSLDTMNELWSLEKGTYNAITLWHVLEHVHDLQAYMARLNELLAENGKLIIAVPNYTSKDAQIYGPYWAAWDVPRHLYHFSPASMSLLAEKHNLKIINYKPMWFDSFYVSMLSSKYKTGATKLLGAFLSGLRSNIKALGNVQRCSSIIYILEKK
ncbi:MAG: class I SAM-dependent methyltransferase [Bacteroidetes bacterium]|nr:class I SAM-dependent methyltransferase [Bacteroidota bacterium]